MIRAMNDDMIRIRNTHTDLFLESDEYGVDLELQHGDGEPIGSTHIRPGEVVFLIDFLEKALEKWDKREI
jgi:hypothetical protein